MSSDRLDKHKSIDLISYQDDGKEPDEDEVEQAVGHG
jgi:hypothetical protein